MKRSQLSQLAVFAAVADHGSFRAAAKDLAIAPSAVSQAVAQLETALGITLLSRTTRSVHLTEAGQKLLTELAPALGNIDVALRTVQDMRTQPSGTVKVSTPRSAAHIFLAPKFKSFGEAYPDIVLDIHIEDQFVDIVAAGFDAGIRLGESLAKDMIAVPLGGALRCPVVASPAYLEQYGTPQHPQDLIAHRCILKRYSSGGLHQWEFEKQGRRLDVTLNGPLILDDNHLLLQAALDGAGLVSLLEPSVADYLQKGTLTEVLPDWAQQFPGMYIYYPNRRNMRPALRAFIDFFKL
ncbi:LysR family transcriptional regulator [Bacillus subtilis]|uniref:LysR family transcriptional regulator n=1 Tax=Pseudochrobactrum asaccharolyticum TaxID=354351 RepID=UPI001F18A806|nr:LysR family transcriptional regulator [Pseudochrobactrum asaccharolyticum]MCF7644565.1 LysR family transcriptional regulator [Pseudochrobactrum asaccharolyticum]MCF7670196.1 LysR family transcriptional regulator [Bacillus subtilis]